MCQKIVDVFLVYNTFMLFSRPLHTWSLCVAAGAASSSSLCLSSSDSLLRPPGALIIAVSPAKRKRRAESDPGNSNCCIVKQKVLRIFYFPGLCTHGRCASRRGRFLQLPVLEQLRFAASSTGRAHRRCVANQAQAQAQLWALSKKGCRKVARAKTQNERKQSKKP